MRYSFLILILVFSIQISFAQEEEVIQKDNIFLDNIATAFFDLSPGEIDLSPGKLPILKKGSSLLFMFDDLDSDVKEYYYRVYHCTKDWIKSDISEWQFIDGINEFVIEDYESDDARYSEYTTYNFRIPNDDLQILISGNYILEIYDNNGDEEVLAMTKRFIYVESLIGIDILNKPISAINFLHNQEINLNVDFRNFPMLNPKAEVFVAVYQNGAWGSEQNNIQASNLLGKKLIFNQFKPIVFPGLREFREFDTRTLKFASRYVEAIDRHEEGTDVLLKLDIIRHEFFTEVDMNGSFEIYDSPYVMDGEEYVNVTFNLKANQAFEHDVYVYGALSDWGLNDSFKMTYNDEMGLYYVEVLLKQGIFNYLYAFDIDGKVDVASLESSSGHTLNNYNIVVYYRTLGKDYDQIIGMINYQPFFKN